MGLPEAVSRESGVGDGWTIVDVNVEGQLLAVVPASGFV